MKVAVIGSGPTGVSVASALLQQGVAVDVFDMGYSPEPSATELATRVRSGEIDTRVLNQLNQGKGVGTMSRIDTLKLLLTRRADGGLVNKKRLGSDYTFRNIGHSLPLEGAAAIPRSLAKGGLSNVWGSACYPLRPEDYARWPVPENVMRGHYEAVAKTLELEESLDDLSQVYPVYSKPRSDLQPISATARVLQAHWGKHGDDLRRLGVHHGRARCAVRFHGDTSALSATDTDHERGRVGCQRCGLCMSGCPWDAIYRSTRTWSRLAGNKNLRQRSGHLVRHIDETRDGSYVVSHERNGPYDAIFLAAGPLSSLRIAVESLRAFDHRAPVLDNDMFIIPSLGIGSASDDPTNGSFALSELALSIAGSAVGGHSLHVQVYSAGEQLGAQMRARYHRSMAALAALPIAAIEHLMTAFLYMHSDDSMQATARIQPRNDQVPLIQLDVNETPQSQVLKRRALRLMRRNPLAFGMVPLTAISTPFGFSGHACGTLPMRAHPRFLETHVNGLVEGTRALFAVDASTFPVLPSQNLTYTAMANAFRIGSEYAAAMARVPRLQTVA